MLKHMFRKKKRQAEPPKQVEMPPDAGAADACWDRPFETLRRKWVEVPTDKDRVLTSDLLKWSDRQLLDWWRTLRSCAEFGSPVTT